MERASLALEKQSEGEQRENVGVEESGNPGNPGNPDVKLDPNGFPLRPQPTDDPFDPLNWNRWIKLVVLLQVSFLGFLGPFSQGAINSAYRPLSEDMNVSITEASYNTTLAIVLAGVAPLVWSPLANVYGRRPVYLFSAIIGIVAGAGSAIATKWGPLLAARCFVGVGTSAGMGIGASVVSDMYFMHERGRYMGIYVVFTNNGAHLAALIGGYVAKYSGSWTWCYWVPCIALAVTWAINVFALPETLYARKVELKPHQRATSWIRLFSLRAPSSTRHCKVWDFAHCFLMLKYPSVLLTAIYYSYAFGIGTVLFAVTGSAAFGSIYGFDTAQVGLAIGLPTTIGSVIGEFASGPLSDQLVLRYDRRSGGRSAPEARLHAIWPALIILPAGVIIEGVCLQYHTHWSGPTVGIGIASFGLQMVSTNVFAYLTDCYRAQGAEISTLLNFGRLTFSFTLGFYMIPFAHATSYSTAWVVMAMIAVALYSGIVALMLKGQQWRERMGAPNFDREL